MLSYAVHTFMKRFVLALAVAFPFCVSSQSFHRTAQASPAAKGLFPTSTDIGTAQRGATEYDPSAASYRISGGGDDVWGTADDFRFTWTQISGNASLAADVHIEAPVTYRLAKGMLMFRQNLSPGSPYADVAIHADGHVTLQYRLTEGGETKDVTLPQHNPTRLRITRDGDRFSVSAGSEGNMQAERSVVISVPMQGPIYAGLGVCSHNTDVLQNITFSGITLDVH